MPGVKRSTSAMNQRVMVIAWKIRPEEIAELRRREFKATAALDASSQRHIASHGTPSPSLSSGARHCLRWNWASSQLCICGHVFRTAQLHCADGGDGNGDGGLEGTCELGRGAPSGFPIASTQPATVSRL
jgi:hypothetical protein